jgi:hypothetical protein
MKRVLGCLTFAAAVVACGGGLGSTLPFMCEANGKSYVEGESFDAPCGNTCSCAGGKITCSRRGCLPEDAGGPAIPESCDYSMCLDHGTAGSTRVPTGRSRDYWAVFLQPDGRSAFLIPRADGAGLSFGECGRATELAQILERYGFCKAVLSPAEVDVINSMLQVDALKIAAYLHANLRFVRVEGGISPYPYTSDIIEVCRANPGAKGLEVLCAQTEKAIVTDPRPDPPYVHTEAEDDLLVPLLNQLYGVRPLDARP